MEEKISRIIDIMRRRGVSSVLIDSRSVVDAPHSLFFALRTPNNDGHNYISELLAAGVRAFVVDHIPEGIDPTEADFVVVESVVGALQDLAAAYRRQELASTRMVAVAGSRGKTIVKEWIAMAMSALGREVARSPRSYNSHIGVPLSLLSLPEGSPVAVVEAGVSRRGEMEVLERLIRPELVVITGVEQREHSEGFASFNEKCDEKLRLAARARAVVFPAELEEAVERYVPVGVLKISVAMPDGATWADKDRLLVEYAMQYLVGQSVDPDVLRPIETRLDVTQGVNNCLVISDHFTCDLQSIGPALDFMSRRRPAELRPTVILDELRGERNLPLLGELLRRRGIERFIAVGADFEEYRELFPANSSFFASGAELTANLSVADFGGDFILAKGEVGGAVALLAERLNASHHETVLEVNLDAVVHNFNVYRSMLRPSTGIVAMVKASGYGAGAFELARTLQSQGAAYLAVAVVDEGEELRRHGIIMPIMALNPKVTNYDSLFANRLEPEVFSFEMLEEIVREGRKRSISRYPIHIKFDTGMHRLGFLAHQIPLLCKMLRKCADVVTVSSVFSHLATADCLDMDQYTLEQLDLFTEICRQMRATLGYDFKRHILNSAGIARFPQWQFEMVRLGIGLYGIDTLGIEATKALRPVSALKSIVISLKEWGAGTAIGYSRRTILTRRSVIATVPVGYADGLDRHLGNGHGHVWVNGTLCPIAGNVCMDACMIDVTDAPDVAVGTSVEFFGPNNPVDTMAAQLDTIPYEILTSVSPRVKRVYYRE